MNKLLWFKDIFEVTNAMLNINDNINNGPQIATQEKQIRIRIRRNSVAAVRHFLFH